MVSFVYIPPGHAVGEEGAHTPGARLGFKGEVTTWAFKNVSDIMFLIKVLTP